MIKQILVTATMACLIATQPLLAAEQTFEANDDGQVEFITPSGNIGCTFTPQGGTDVYEPVDGGPELLCDRLQPSYVRVILGAQDEAVRQNDVGEASCCGAVEKFEYGNTWEMDGFTCWSKKTGLTCESEADHGFLISKAKIKVY
jgi:hypothetical protein